MTGRSMPCAEPKGRWYWLERPFGQAQGNVVFEPIKTSVQSTGAFGLQLKIACRAALTIAITAGC